MNRNWTPGSTSDATSRKGRKPQGTSLLAWDDDDDSFDEDFDLDKELAKIKSEDVQKKTAAVQPMANDMFSASKPLSKTETVSQPEPSLRSSSAKSRSTSAKPDVASSPLKSDRRGKVFEGFREKSTDQSAGMEQISEFLKTDVASAATSVGAGYASTKKHTERLVALTKAQGLDDDEEEEMKSSGVDSDFFDRNSVSSDDLLKESFAPEQREKKTERSRKPTVEATRKGNDEPTKVKPTLGKALPSAANGPDDSLNPQTSAYTPSPKQHTTKRVFKFPSAAPKRRPLSDPFAKIVKDEGTGKGDSNKQEAKEPVPSEMRTSIATSGSARLVQDSTIHSSAGPATSHPEIEEEKSRLKQTISSNELEIKSLQSQKRQLQEEVSLLKGKLTTAEALALQRSKEVETVEKAKRFFEERVASLQKELEAARADFEVKQLALKEERQGLAELRSVGAGLESSVKLLEELSLKFTDRFESSEHSRSVQLEAREKLVAQVEQNAREQREKATQEASRLQAIVESLEASNQLVHVRHEEERCRLREEHSRLDALKLTLTTEAEIIRNDVAEERIRLRDEKERWEPYKREQEANIALQLEEARSMWRKYYKEQADFELERKAYAKEKETFAARVREEETRLSRSREELLSTRRTVAEAKHTLDLEKHQLADQASALGREKQAAATERKRVEEATKLLQTREAEVDRKLAEISGKQTMAEEALRRCETLKAAVEREKSTLDAKLHQVALGQRRYRELRLSVVQQHHVLHTERAAASKLASDSRRLQNTLLQQLVCPIDEGRNNTDAMQSLVDQALKTIPILSGAASSTSQNFHFPDENFLRHNVDRRHKNTKAYGHRRREKGISCALRKIDQEFDSISST